MSIISNLRHIDADYGCEDKIIAVKNGILFMGSPERFFVVKKTKEWIRKKVVAIVVKSDSVELIKDKSKTIYIPFCKIIFREFFNTFFPSVKDLIKAIPNENFLMYGGKLYVGSIPNDIIFDLTFKKNKLKVIVAKRKKEVKFLEKYPPSFFLSVPGLYYAHIKFSADKFYNVLDAVLTLNYGDNYFESVIKVPPDYFGLLKVHPELITIYPFAEKLFVSRHTNLVEVTTDYNYYNFDFVRVMSNKHSVIKTIGIASLGWDL